MNAVRTHPLYTFVTPLACALFFILAFPLVATTTNLNEDFESADWGGWVNTNDWEFDSGVARINGSYSLNDTTTSDDTNYIATNVDIDISTDGCFVKWQFNLKYSYNPSGSSHFYVVLYADEANLISATMNGYAIGVNVDGDTGDKIVLWKMTGGEHDTALIDLGEGAKEWPGTATPQGIIVTRETNGGDVIWKLYLDQDGDFDDISMASPDGTHTETGGGYLTASHFGLVYRCNTGSAEGDLRLDDVLITREATAPVFNPVEEVAFSNVSIAGSVCDRNDANVPVLAFSLTSTSNGGMLTNIAITNEGTAVRSTDYENAQLWYDAGTHGAYDSGADTLIGTLTWDAATSRWTNRLSASIGDASLGTNFLVTVDIPAGATYGNTLSFRIEQSALVITNITHTSNFILPDADTTPQTITVFDPNISTLTEGFEGVTYPPAGWSSNNSPDQSGSWQHAGSYAAQFSAGADELITPQLAQPGVMTFWLMKTSGGGSDESFIVEYATSLGGPYTEAATVTLNAEDTFEEKTVDLSSYDNVYIKFRRIDNRYFYIDDVVVEERSDGERATFTMNTLSATTHAPGTTNAPVMAFKLESSSNDAMLTNIALSLSGTATRATDYDTMRLWYDRGTKGAYDAVDTLIDTIAYDSGSDTWTNYALSASLGAMNAGTNFLVTVNSTTNATNGDTVTASFAANSIVVTNTTTTSNFLLPSGTEGASVVSFKVSGVNMLVNQDFDDGYNATTSAPNSWVWGESRGELSTTYAIAGTKSFLHEPYSSSKYLLQTNFTVTEGTTYYAVVWARGSGRVTPGIAHATGTEYGDTLDLDNSDWKAITNSYTVAAGKGTNEGGIRVKLIRFATTGESLYIGAAWFSDGLPPADWVTFAGDTNAPTLASNNALFPTNNAYDVYAKETLTISFSETVVKGAGAITIKRDDDNATERSIDVSSSDVRVDSSKVFITLTNALAKNNRYYIEIPSGTFVDTAGNAFAGFTGNATWAFTTGFQDEITVNSSFEVDGDGDSVPDGWTSNDTFSAWTLPDTTKTFEAFSEPDSGIIPEGQNVARFYLRDMGAAGTTTVALASEQTHDTFGTVTHETVNTLNYYIELDYGYYGSDRCNWAGAIVEVLFTTGTTTNALRYYHPAKSDYVQVPTESDTTQYVIADVLETDEWTPRKRVTLNDDISNAFDITNFTITAIRFGAAIDRRDGTQEVRLDISFDGMRLELAPVTESFTFAFAPLSPMTVQRGEENTLVSAFSVISTSNDATLSSISISNVGNLSHTDITSLFLAYDTDGDGAYGALDTIITNLSFTNGVYANTALSASIGDANTGTNFLVLCTITQNAISDRIFQAGYAASSIVVTNATYKTLATFPVEKTRGRMVTVETRDRETTLPRPRNTVLSPSDTTLVVENIPLGATVSIYSPRGVKVGDVSLLGTSGTWTLPAYLASGVYLVVIAENGKQSTSFKIIVIR